MCYIKLTKKDLIREAVKGTKYNIEQIDKYIIYGETIRNPQHYDDTNRWVAMTK